MTRSKKFKQRVTSTFTLGELLERRVPSENQHFSASSSTAPARISPNKPQRTRWKEREKKMKDSFDESDFPQLLPPAANNAPLTLKIKQKTKSRGSENIELASAKRTLSLSTDNAVSESKISALASFDEIAQAISDIDSTILPSDTSVSLSSTSSLIQESFTYSIKPGRCTNSRFIRKRSIHKYINLRSFLNKTTKTYIYHTGKGNLSEEFDINVEEKIQEEEQEEKQFPQYITEDEVTEGLNNGSLVQGNIRINQKNQRDSYVSNLDDNSKDFYISSVCDRNRALDGDKVVLRIKPEEEWTPNYQTAIVVYIKEKVHNRTAVGTLRFENQDFVTFVSRDRRFPHLRICELNLPSGFGESPETFKDVIFMAELLEWHTPMHADGKLTEQLGKSGKLEVETLSILKEYSLDITPFGEEIKVCLPDFKTIPEGEFIYREDLRKKCIFTIDPATARDLDDAVSVESLPNGNYEVGVHIADAAFYLQEGNKLDEIVSKKATTIYMVDKVYHMLPQEICLGCSLLPGEDKLSFSVFWEMTSEGEVVDTRFQRTVMQSCVKLSYEHAQNVIENPNKIFTTKDFPKIYNGFETNDIVETIKILQSLAIIMRQRRFQNGALKIGNIKLTFTLDPTTGEPTDFSAAESKEAHQLIEEFMLLANISVAERIYEHFPDIAFLRRHERPKQNMLDELQRKLAEYGLHFNMCSAGGIAASLQKYSSPNDTGYSRGIALKHLTAKTMNRAKYFCTSTVESGEDFKHYALNVSMYTHFTSPIRRYADIMVHRLLAASLGYQDKLNWDTDYVESIAINCNIQNYHAKKAGDASMELYLAHYIEKNQPFREDCVVVDIRDRKIDVIGIKTGVCVRVYHNNCGKGTNWKFENDKVTVTFPENQTFAKYTMVVDLFSVVTVQLRRKDSYQIQGQLLRPRDTAVKHSPQKRKKPKTKKQNQM